MVVFWVAYVTCKRVLDESFVMWLVKLLLRITNWTVQHLWRKYIHLNVEDQVYNRDNFLENKVDFGLSMMTDYDKTNPVQ